jgi:hypothetical protein
LVTLHFAATQTWGKVPTILWVTAAALGVGKQVGATVSVEASSNATTEWAALHTHRQQEAEVIGFQSDAQGMVTALAKAAVIWLATLTVELLVSVLLMREGRGTVVVHTLETVESVAVLVPVLILPQLQRGSDLAV